MGWAGLCCSHRSLSIFTTERSFLTSAVCAPGGGLASGLLSAPLDPTSTTSSSGSHREEPQGGRVLALPYGSLGVTHVTFVPGSLVRARQWPPRVTAGGGKRGVTRGIFGECSCFCQLRPPCLTLSRQGYPRGLGDSCQETPRAACPARIR